MALTFIGSLLFMFSAIANDDGEHDGYICPPCGCAQDGNVFEQPGDCSACGMELVSRSSLKDVAIVVFPGVELLDFAGPGEVFAAARNNRVFTIGVSKEPIVSQGFLTVTPEATIAESETPDILVIPGGGVGSLLDNPEAMEALAHKVRDAQIVLSVCNGALVLARLGVLDGLEATTHHGSIDSLRRFAPKCLVHEDRRFVDNGKIVTAAGVSAGIDASLHLIAREQGLGPARRVARYMEYTWNSAMTESILEERTRAEESAAEAASLPLALRGLDPISLIEGQEVHGQESLIADDGWYRYQFTSAEHRRRFLEDRQRYGIQARGSCAGMGAQIAERSGSPDLFTIHEGMIYIFAGPNCLDDFLAEPARYVKEMREAVAQQWSDV